MGTKAPPVAAAALLLAALAGCGGGADPEQATPALPAPGIEEDVAPAAASAQAPAQDPSPGALVGPVDTSLVPQPGAPLVREIYNYAGGNRDPFVSVLESGLTGPELGDLILVAIHYDSRMPARSVAVMRDRVTGKRYTAQAGDRLGPRLRVTEIRLKDVRFLVDDFGTARQETLSLRKQEVETP